jgi:hypothetical protein
MERTRDDNGEDLGEPATKKRRLNQEGHNTEDPTRYDSNNDLTRFKN